MPNLELEESIPAVFVAQDINTQCTCIGLLFAIDLSKLEDLGDDKIELGPHLEVKTCDQSDDGFQPKPVTDFYL